MSFHGGTPWRLIFRWDHEHQDKHDEFMLHVQSRYLFRGYHFSVDKRLERSFEIDQYYTGPQPQLMGRVLLAHINEIPLSLSVVPAGVTHMVKICRVSGKPKVPLILELHGLALLRQNEPIEQTLWEGPLVEGN